MICVESNTNITNFELLWTWQVELCTCSNPGSSTKTKLWSHSNPSKCPNYEPVQPETGRTIPILQNSGKTRHLNSLKIPNFETKIWVRPNTIFDLFDFSYFVFPLQIFFAVIFICKKTDTYIFDSLMIMYVFSFCFKIRNIFFQRFNFFLSISTMTIPISLIRRIFAIKKWSCSLQPFHFTALHYKSRILGDSMK